MHVFCAMFDRKVLDPFQVHNFGFFITVKKSIYFPKNLKSGALGSRGDVVLLHKKTIQWIQSNC